MVNTAVILATDDTGLEPVFGIPATRRLVLILIRLGIPNIHVVGRVSMFVPLLSDLIPQQFFHSLEGDEQWEQAGRELDALSTERVMVLKANHVADRYTLSRLLDCSQDVSLCRMDAEGEQGPGNGIYLVGPENLTALLHALWSETPVDPVLWGDLRHLQSRNELPCLLIREANGRGLCEGRLVGALSAQTEADDGFIARHFDRRISQFISRRLACTRIMPNQITLAGMTMGLLGAYLLSLTGYWPKFFGSLLFVVCVIVDGVDGEVARLKLKESTFGHYLDIVTDNMVHAAVFAGIAFGLYHDTGNVWYLRFLWLLIGGFGLCLVAVYQCILRLDPESLKRSPKTLQLMTLATNRDFAYLVFVLAIAGQLNWFLFGAAVGSYLFAMALWLISYRERCRNSELIDGRDQA